MGLIAKVKGVTPPEAVTGVKGVTEIDLVKENELGGAVVVNAGGVTLRVKLADCVAPLLSVTVTVYVIAPLLIVGVPEIAPVELLKVSPVGSAGLIAKVKGVTPPVAEIGIKALTAVFNGKSLDAIATFTVKGVAPPETPKEKVADAV